ncbi:hypothetical protein V5N11_001109 [Cardamine amara subsp. amara]|uniref:DUF287 domain-containing protein n=1 Tax=Cardamine amara subsp. amara TaxID=228776 RepID=A0ABD1C5C6_CARAN
MHFRENVPCEDQCPRMCKGRFKDSSTKGFGLGDIYKGLGNSTEISSILVAKGEELDLMAEIMGEEDDLKYDMVVDGWTTILANDETIL